MRKLIIKISVALIIVALGVAGIAYANNYLIPNSQLPNENKPTDVIPEEGTPNTKPGSDISRVPTKTEEVRTSSNDKISYRVNIIITDINGKRLHDDIHVTKHKRLIDLLDECYDVRYSMEGPGAFLYDIEEIKTDKWHTFIAIYVNDSFSSYGIDSLILYDGIKIELREARVK